MDLVFYLSGEHKTLPKSEVLSLFKHRQIECRVLEDLDQVLILRVSKMDLEDLGLLAMTHEVLGYLGSCYAEISKMTKLARGLEEIRQSFSVRVIRIKHFSPEHSTLSLEKMIGGVLNGVYVDLKNPQTRFKGFLTEDRFVLGKSILEIKRSLLAERNPKNRPYFHPSSLSPLFSRALCNICGVGEGKKVLDPFCGTGGILIEAAILGAEVYGVDIDEQMVLGTTKNLEHFGLNGVIERADSTDLNFKDKFDIVITDPPYGRSSTTKGREITSLYIRAVESIHRALKKGGISCVISPDTLLLENISENAGFRVWEMHKIRVHKSLTRKIVFMEKPQ